MKRRIARESALQILFSLEPVYSKQKYTSTTLQGTIESYFHHFRDRDSVDESFLSNLLKGVWKQYASINTLLSAQSDHWQLKRMTSIDRSILRLAIYELIDRPDVDHSVTINEAIEISKQYSTKGAGAFINGVLDQIHRELSKKETPK